MTVGDRGVSFKEQQIERRRIMRNEGRLPSKSGTSSFGACNAQLADCSWEPKEPNAQVGKSPDAV